MNQLNQTKANPTISYTQIVLEKKTRKPQKPKPTQLVFIPFLEGETLMILIFTHGKALLLLSQLPINAQGFHLLDIRRHC